MKNPKAQEFMKNPNLRNCYKTSAERQALTTEDKRKARTAYCEYVLSNKTDDGNRGKAFEVLAREFITPRSSVLKCQSPGKNDLTKVIRTSDGKEAYNIECKTGSGEIYHGELPENWRELDMNNIIEWDYIVYNPFYDGTTESLICDTFVLSRAAFVEWVKEFDEMQGRGKKLSYLTYKPKECRLMLANIRSTETRRAFAENILDTMGDCDGVYTLDEFKALMNGEEI